LHFILLELISPSIKVLGTKQAFNIENAFPWSWSLCLWQFCQTHLIVNIKTVLYLHFHWRYVYVQ